MSTLIKQPKRIEGLTILHKFLFVLLAAMMLVVFLKPEYSNVCGPILAVLFTVLFFAGYHEFVFAVIITANNSLGTIFMGSVSFQYLLLALAIIKIFQHLSLTKRHWLFLFICSYFLVQLLLLDEIITKVFLNSVSYIVAIATLQLDMDDRTICRFFSGVAISVVLISIHAMITGGVDFSETFGEISETSEHYLRRGTLGVGDGNPNYSAFLLNIGIISLWHFAQWKVIFKLICTIPILYAFILTNSMSGILSLLLICVLTILLQQDRNSKTSKRIFVTCIVVLVLIGLYTLYTDLPDAMRLDVLDNYISRAENKLEFAQEGNWREFTTNRSRLATKYLRYIFTQQDVLGMLFGGNSLIVPGVSAAVAHNNYLNILLQVGVIGALLFFATVIKRLVFICKQPTIPYQKGRLILKCFCLFASFGISLNSNSLWAFLMMILILV